MVTCKTRIHTGSISRLSPNGTSLSPPGTEDVRAKAIRILRLAQVLDVTGLGKTKIYELQSAGNFPMRVQMTSHCVGWIEHEVQAWLAQRVAARSDAFREPVPNIARTSDSLTLRCPRG